MFTPPDGQALIGRYRRQAEEHLKRPVRVLSCVYHGLRKAHLGRYLDEFVFRWNRRRHTRAAFDTLRGIGVRLTPATYRDFVTQQGNR